MILFLHVFHRFSSLLLQVFFSYANLVWLHFYSPVRKKKIVMYNVNEII